MTMRFLIPLILSLALASGQLNMGKRALGRREANQKKLIEKQIEDVAESKMESSRSDGKGNRMKRVEEVEDDEKGDKVIRMKQTYRDIEVLGAEVTKAKIRGGIRPVVDKGTGKETGKRHVKPHTSNAGKVYPDLDRELGKFDPDELKDKQGDVLKKVEKEVDARRKKRSATAGEMDVKDRKATPVIVTGNLCGKKVKTQTGYKVGFHYEDADGESRPETVTDKDGKILCEWNNVMSNRKEQRGTGPGGNSKMGKYNYGKEFDKMTVTVMDNGRCKMESDTVKTINLNGGTNSQLTNAFEFGCYNHDSDAINGAYSPLNDAHYYGGKVYSLYVDWYGKSPLKSTPLVMKVHYKKNYENAFWNGRAMTFGDGANRFHPLVSLDVMSHEVSHGVTEQTSGLRYQGHSGGLNEAFSDMAGKAAERYVRGKGKVDWGVGTDIVKGRGQQLRCMNNPECDRMSIGHVSKYHNGMDVHHSSGVFNKVFYLLSQKFKYDVWDAFDLFYTANTKGYWTSDITFNDAAAETLKAADDMKAGRHNDFNYDHINIQDIVNAFNQVGIKCSNSRGWTCRQ